VSTSSTGRPLITANQVTFARLILLPIGTWLLYRGINGQWAALFSMTVVGCTDFVDGMLARRQGPTVLGGLMDPIADKVFVALIFLPMIDLKWLPWWMVTILFVREFVVTAARSSYERRDIPLKSSYLAKVKTWFQMCGAGMFFLFRTIQRPWVMHVVMAALVVSPFVGGGIYYLLKRKWWRGSVVFFFSFGALGALEWTLGPWWAGYILGWAIVAITWASGGVYMFRLGDLRKKQPIDVDDLVRWFGALALPVLATMVMARNVGPSWPIMATFALEFGVGGLDNLLAHVGELPRWPGWAARVFAQAGFLAAALWLSFHDGSPQLIYWLLMATFAATLVSTAILFWRRRSAYLSDRVQRNVKTVSVPAPWI